MSGMAKAQTELRPNNHRVEAFSDAVFAIVLTIMVLEIRIPDGLAFANDAVALREFAALIITYALSFLVVAILWGSHHYLIFTLPTADRTSIWLNNHVLFWVTLIPVVAKWSAIAKLGAFHLISPRMRMRSRMVSATVSRISPRLPPTVRWTRMAVTTISKS